VNRFRGFLVPRPDWIKVLCLFGTLGLHRLLTKTLKFSQNFKISEISKFSTNFKILGLKIKIENFHKILKFQNFKKIQNVHKTCSHHVN
jgi:hypothetical protein